MKKRIAVAIACALLLTLTVLTALAGWSSPMWYTPRTATYKLTTSRWQITGAKWSSTGVANYKALKQDQRIVPYWEWEARIRTSGSETILDPNDYYTGVDYLDSNLPSSYDEFDEDDISIGCSAANNLVAETSYSSYLYLFRNGSATAPGFKGESEYGEWLMVDGWPYAYQVHLDYVTMNTSTNW